MKRTYNNKKESSYMTYNIPDDQTQANERQVKNTAGGFVYQVDKFALLRRCLILGTKFGSYYIRAKDMTAAYGKVIEDCAKESPANTYTSILQVYESGVYLEEDSVLFAMVRMCASKNEHVREYGVKFIPKLRTGTALLTFCAMMNQHRGWGRSVRGAISDWYNGALSKTAYQILKYQSRSGWSHRDVLRKAHVVPASDFHNVLMSYAVDGWKDEWTYGIQAGDPLRKYVFKGKVGNMRGKKSMVSNYLLFSENDFLGQIYAYELVKKCKDTGEIVALTSAHRLTVEMIPTEKRTVEVWQALMFNMPIASLIRNLNKLSSLKLFNSKENLNHVLNILGNAAYARAARVHPLDVYLASEAYKQGSNENFRWVVVDEISDALDKLLNAMLTVDESEKNNEKKVLIAIDHSGSMSARITDGVSCVDGSAFMATYLKSKFALADCITFSTGMSNHPVELTNSVKTNLDRINKSQGWGGTSCSDAVMYATRLNKKYDAIIILTDAETWAGQHNFSYAINEYRRYVNDDCRVINLAMVANKYTLADELGLKDMELTGFDSNITKVIESFISGDQAWG